MIAGDYLKNNTLLLGGSGTLGKTIINSNLFKNLIHPTKKKLNILDQNRLQKFLKKNNINLILHCAALARVKECEINKKKAYTINITGTSNVVNAVLEIKKIYKKKIKLVFISSDAVYPSTKGNYKETDELMPYNFYGWTKLIGEGLVKFIENHIIIRTRFFDKNKIPFKYSANNIYTSSLEVNDLVYNISKLIKRNFQGIINVGGPSISDYKKYKNYKKNLKPCDKSKILKKLNFKMATDASLNINKLKLIK